MRACVPCLIWPRDGRPALFFSPLARRRRSPELHQIVMLQVFSCGSLLRNEWCPFLFVLCGHPPMNRSKLGTAACHSLWSKSVLIPPIRVIRVLSGRGGSGMNSVHPGFLPARRNPSRVTRTRVHPAPPDFGLKFLCFFSCQSV